MTGDPTRCSKAEFARLRGYYTSYVSKLHRKHRLVIDKDGLVVVESTDKLIAATRDPTRGGDRTGKHAQRVAAAAVEPRAERTASSPSAPPAAGESMSLADAARAEKIERASLLRLQVAEKAGELVRRDVVEAEAFRRGRQARDLLLALRDRLPPLLAIEAEERAIGDLLEAEFRQVIAIIAGPVTAESAASLERAA
jgi:hypothetical protein